MQETQETELVGLIKSSMLEGQGGIKIRAFLAFNRDNGLATAENLDILKEKGATVINDDTIFPVDVI